MNKKIGTHSGTFHCDEALACYMLTNLTNEFKGCEIVRSRNRDVLQDLDILVDIGGIYDPTCHRYDHHQRGFMETLSTNHQTKLSSAGLIYKHFGKEIISNIMDIPTEYLDLVYLKVYTDFVEAIDGIDNGITQYTDAKGEELKPVYISHTDVSSRVHYLNPLWNETDIDIPRRFEKAMQMVGEEFVACVHRCIKSWLPAYQLVKYSVNIRHQHFESGEIMVLDQYTDWQSHIYNVEEELKANPILYILYPNNTQTWCIRSVPVCQGSFKSRQALPEPWRGLNGKALNNATGIEGCTFIHASGFIGGNKTFEGVLHMAKRAIEYGKNVNKSRKKRKIQVQGTQ